MSSDGTERVEKGCGHPETLTYPASDGWRCSVCDSLVSEFDDSDSDPRGGESESSSSGRTQNAGTGDEDDGREARADGGKDALPEFEDAVGHDPGPELEACPDCGYPTDACECHSLFGGDPRRDPDLAAPSQPSWIRDGGEGLPIPDHTDKEGKVWLFTCCGCGTRWANPPAPPASCSCGSDEIVCHRLEHERYMAIFAHGNPEPERGDE